VWAEPAVLIAGYNSETMRVTTPGSDARAWYWLKCSELAYLQTAPPDGPGEWRRGRSGELWYRMRSKHLTGEATVRLP
jgi:hypothetical protein